VKAEDLMVKAVASGLGLGYLPLAPGTAASAAGAVVYVLLRRLPGASGALILVWLLVAASVAGVLICPRAQALYGQPDPRRFVLDEIAGVWLTCLLFWWRGPLATAAAAFVAFRVFDGLKPFGLRRLEKLPGGWGVMADDFGAAAYSALVLWPACYGIVDRLVS
jgi:phosphatidylglycerophosphatase A